MMHMTFYWGRKVTLLFDFWKTESWISYSLTLLAVFLFSVFYQYMEDRRLRFKVISSAVPSVSSVDTPLLGSRLYSKRQVAKFAVAFLFGINSAIGYLLMLAVMSYNGGVFVAVVLGLFVGYSIFKSGEEEIVVVDNPCACA
ncbi:copper transporter 5 [Aristolochia californica]|uniref:copper transporter 5 n=1 Tax=Aristolochia californica TaxID=171875 RepID=UPI0035DFDB08